MNFDDFSYTENDRRYINPQVSLDEQNAFIDNLRNMQSANTAQITQDTRNLGTQVPSNLGGLGGGTSYFTSRYQTPQTNSMVSDLRATAQAEALNTLLNNELSKAQKRYNDAYRAAKKRSSSGGGGGGNTLSNLLEALGVKEQDDGSSDPLNTEGISSTGDASDLTRQKDIERLKGEISIKEGQLENLLKNGRYSGYSGFEKFMTNINPIANIANANVYASNYNRYNSELEALRKQLAELER